MTTTVGFIGIGQMGRPMVERLAGAGLQVRVFDRRAEALEPLAAIAGVHRADSAESIADLALLRGTGARGLRAILEEVLLNTMYELPGRADVGRVVIDADTVATKAIPSLVPREPVTKRPRRQAS